MLTGAGVELNAAKREVGNAKLKKVICAGKYKYPKNCDLTDDCKDLIQKMLTVDPKERITIPEALNHPWIKKAENGLH